MLELRLNSRDGWYKFCPSNSGTLDDIPLDNMQERVQHSNGVSELITVYSAMLNIIRLRTRRGFVATASLAIDMD
jgi:hypothetical protein